MNRSPWVFGAAAIAACWLGGTAVVRLLHLPLPGSLLGMAVITLAVRAGWIPEAWIRAPAAWLIRWMPLFFVPAGVAVSVEGARVGGAWLPIVAGAAASTVAVIAVVGRIHQHAAADA